MTKLKKALTSCAVIGILVAFACVAAYAAQEQTGKVTCNVLNVRAGAGTGTAVIDQINKGTVVTIISSSNGWYHVRYGNGKTGWVCADYIEIGFAGYGVITGSVVNVRSGPGTSYGILTTMKKGQKAGIIGRYNGWYNIRTPDGITGWVTGEYFSVTETVSRGGTSDIPVIEPSVQTAVNLSRQESIVALAKSYLGYRYVYGGSTPEGGFDCSGFTKYIFGRFSINLYRTAAEQAKMGTPVSKSELRIGDLVFFNTYGSSYINHVGIYIGDGKFIHASNPKYGVTITDLTTGFYANCFTTARRIIQ